MRKINEKYLKMEAKKDPKCLIGIEKNGLETTLATSSGLGGPKGACTKPPAAYFDPLFIAFEPRFQYPAAVLALPPMLTCKVHLTVR